MDHHARRRRAAAAAHLSAAPVFRTLMLASLMLVATAGESPAAPKRAASARARESATVIPLRHFLGDLRSLTVVSGVDTAQFLLDTGGGLTLLTPEFAKRRGLVPYGRVRGPRMDGSFIEMALCDSVALRIGGYDAPPMTVGVFDLGKVLPPGLPPLGGIVALPSFRGRTLTLDWAHDTLVVESARSAAARVARMSPMRMRLATGNDGAGLTALVAARPARGTLWLLLDSGDLLGTLLAPHAVRAFSPLLADSVGAQPTMAVALEGLEPVPETVIVRDILYDGVLGARFLRRGVWTLDLAAERMWGRWSP